MKWSSFLKDKMLLICLLILVLITIEIFLMTYEISMGIRIYVLISPIVVTIIAILIEYNTKKNFYCNLKQKMQELDQKYLISELIDAPDFIEGKILTEVMQDVGKSRKCKSI